jgi:AraC family transcriptional regulator
MTEAAITVKSRDVSHSADSARVKRLPFAIEHNLTPDGDGYEFEWTGASAYLALHDIVLTDGRMAGDDIAPLSMLDIRGRMTFLPRGVQVSGWSEPARRGNSFTVLYFDQDWLLDELEVAPKHRSLQSALHFQDKSLLQSMTKLGQLARARTPAPAILADSLAIMAGAELMRSLAAKSDPQGGLSRTQLDAVRDFVHAHLLEDISLGDLAVVAGLSVFHFARRFKAATGVAPYRFVLDARLERARILMLDQALPLSVVAQRSGFSSASQFSKCFTSAFGISPRAFRGERNLS